MADANCTAEMKKCSRCGESKPATKEFFHARHDKPGGLAYQCKACRAAARMKWQKENRDEYLARKRRNYETHYAANKAKIAAARREYRQKHPEAIKVQRSKRRARMAGADGAHTADDVREIFALQRGKCAACGGLLDKGFHADHIVPLALGGSNGRENIQVLCPTCNLSKRHKHPVDFMQQKGFLL